MWSFATPLRALRPFSLIPGLLATLAIGLSAPLAMAAQTDPPDQETLTVSALICDAESREAASAAPTGVCQPLAGPTVTVTSEDGSVVERCSIAPIETPNGSGAVCAVRVPFETTFIVTLDESAIPPGYALEENGVVFTSLALESGGGESSDVTFRVFQQQGPAPGDAPAGDPADETAGVPDTQSPPGARTGSPAAIYAGDCDTDAFTDPVAVLSEVTGPDGEGVGAGEASAVETSFTSLDLTLSDLLAEDHVLVVFDEDDDTVALACGAIGGVLAADGSLAFGLPVVGDSLFAGVAYLSPAGDQTLATVFLAERLLAEDDPST